MKQMKQIKQETVTPEMEQIRSMIMQTVMQRDTIKSEMERWYNENPQKHFPKMKELMFTDATLSKLDSFYKKLWDYHNAR